MRLPSASNGIYPRLHTGTCNSVAADPSSLARPHRRVASTTASLCVPRFVIVPLTYPYNSLDNPATGNPQIYPYGTSLVELRAIFAQHEGNIPGSSPCARSPSRVVSRLSRARLASRARCPLSARWSSRANASSSFIVACAFVPVARSSSSRVARATPRPRFARPAAVSLSCVRPMRSPVVVVVETRV